MEKSRGIFRKKEYTRWSLHSNRHALEGRICLMLKNVKWLKVKVLFSELRSSILKFDKKAHFLIKLDHGSTKHVLSSLGARESVG